MYGIILRGVWNTPKYINHKSIIGQGSTPNTISVPKGRATPPNWQHERIRQIKLSSVPSIPKFIGKEVEKGSCLQFWFIWYFHRRLRNFFCNQFYWRFYRRSNVGQTQGSRDRRETIWKARFDEVSNMMTCNCMNFSWWHSMWPLLSIGSYVHITGINKSREIILLNMELDAQTLTILVNFFETNVNTSALFIGAPRWI